MPESSKTEFDDVTREEIVELLYQIDSDQTLARYEVEQFTYDPESKPGKTFAAIAAAHRQDVIKELQWVLDNASGGGSWRRVLIQRIETLKKESL